jgi:hypothetical protein
MMRDSMTNSGFFIPLGMLLGMMAGCAVDETSAVEQAGESLQGESLQGESLQGESLQGMSMRGIRLYGGMLSGIALTNVRVERGELVAQRAGATLRGTSLRDAHFFAETRNTGTTPPSSAVVEYRITRIDPELSRYDPTDTGNTFLYTLEHWVSDIANWRPACPADADGRRVAIPLAAVWDERGDRSVSNTLFTFGCTTGVIAKCYRWGYRPWITGYGADMAEMHWTCTRMARADYCGNGMPHTHDGTKINLWDTLPPYRGPIQSRGGLLPPFGMVFEAGWNTGGAVCLSRARWLLDDGPQIAQLCPDRLVPPGLGETVCEGVADVLGYDSDAKMFNDAKLNINVLNIRL